MPHISEMLLDEQVRLLDGKTKEPEAGQYTVGNKRTLLVQKVQLKVAQAAVDLWNAFEPVANGEENDARIESLKEEVIPDLAIYRTRLINGFLPLYEKNPGLCEIEGAEGLEVEEDGVAVVSEPHLKILQGAMNYVSAASGELSKYLMPPGNITPHAPTYVAEAVSYLHFGADLLATCYGVDLNEAHIRRLKDLGRYA